MSFRTQNNANKEAAYQRVLDDYTDAFRMLVDKPELAKLQSEMARAAVPGSNTASLSPEDMTGEGMYDKPFMEYVSNILNAKS
jgi:hypothetical protein